MSEGGDTMRRLIHALGLMLFLASCLVLTGCSGNVGIGMSVGVPVGDHGHVSVGASRWR
jgi:hypothetical protein